jgi:hypothetical protein
MIDRLTQLVHFSIIEPRWRDRRVLLSKVKVDQPRNKRKVEGLKITFTGKYMNGNYYLSRTVARRCKVETNGVIDVYCVPLDKLEPLELSSRSKYDW